MKFLQDALENDFIRDILEAQIQNKLQIIKSIIDALQTSDLNINHLNALQKIGEIVENYSQCIVTDRFQPVNSESELEQEAYRLSHSKNFFAGKINYNSNLHFPKSVMLQNLYCNFISLFFSADPSLSGRVIFFVLWLIELVAVKVCTF